MEDLLTWAEQQGAVVRKLRVPHPGSRNFVTAEPILGGETVISLPNSVLLHPGCAFNDTQYGRAFRQLVQEYEALDPRSLLCLLLVVEKCKQQASYWAPFMSVLPDEYDDPYWWEPNQVALLRGTRLGRAVETYRPGLSQLTSWATRLEQLLIQAGGEPGPLTTYKQGWGLSQDAARWARSAVWSRSFTVRALPVSAQAADAMPALLLGTSGSTTTSTAAAPQPKQAAAAASKRNGAGQGAATTVMARNLVAMVPVLDMIDHSPDMEVVWHTGLSGREDFQFAPLVPVPEGRIMSNNYGSKTSDEFLLAYGFLLPEGENTSDYFHVSLARKPAGVGSQAQGAANGAVGSGQQQQQPAAPGGGSSTAAGQAKGGEAGAGGEAESDGDEDEGEGDIMEGEADEDGEQAQQQAEEMQRSLALSSLELEQQYRLTVSQPLPPQLLHAAHISLAPPQQLYLMAGRLCAGVAELMEEEQEEDDDEEEEEEQQQQQQQGGPAVAPGRAGGAQRHRPQHMQVDQQQQVLSGQKRKHEPGEDDEQQPAQVQRTEGPTPTAGAAIMHVCPQGHSNGSSVSSTNGDCQAPVAAAGASGAPAASAAVAAAAASCLPQELQALVSLHQQLESKLQAMAPAEEEKQLEAAAAAPPAQLQGQQSGGAPGRPYHTRMAVQYVRGQKQILHRAMHALHAHAGALVHAGADVIKPEHGIGSTAAGGAAVAAAGATGGAAAVAAVAAASAAATAGSDPKALPFRYEPLAPAQARQQPAAVAADEGQCLTLDVEAHTQHYAAWLDQHGLLQPGDSCKLQEITCKRLLPPSMVPPRPMSTLGTAGKQAAQQQRRPGRGLPTGSRTFRAQQPAQAQQEGSSKGAQNGGAAAGSGNGSDGAASGKRPALPAGLAASVGLDSDHDSVALGARVVQACAPGSTLLQVPAACCLMADSREALICRLMLSAHRLLQSLLRSIWSYVSRKGKDWQCDPQYMSEARAKIGMPSDVLVWQLMHAVASAPAARMALSESDGAQMLWEMLEDAPAGAALQERSAALTSDYEYLRMRAVVGMAEGKGSKQAALLRVFSRQSSFGLFCWAAGAVDRCALKAQCAAAPGGGGRDEMWVLAPVAAAVPPELRAALMRGNLLLPPGGTPGGVLVLEALCELQAGLPLTPLLLLPSLDCDSLMTTYGPEALSWHRILPRTAAASAVIPEHQPHADDGDADDHDDGQHRPSLHALLQRSAPAWARAPRPAHASSSPEVAAATAAAAATGLPCLMYELFIAPSAEDPLYDEKAALLAASGLGTVHYLTDQMDTEALVSAALKVCLADEEVMGHPLVHQCLQLHQMLLAMQQGEPPDADAPVAAAAAAPGADGGADAAATAGPAAAAGVANGGGGVPRGLLQLLRQVQQVLLGTLSTMPDDHPVCRAYRKQLRQIVYEARKNSRRRLRQLESVQASIGARAAAEAGAASAGASRSSAAAAAAVARCAGPVGGSAAMHEGVRLYLQALCGVLDAWADHLGISSHLKQENSSKNSSKRASKHAKQDE